VSVGKKPFPLKSALCKSATALTSVHQKSRPPAAIFTQPLN
jgi:hypothetical protein